MKYERLQKDKGVTLSKGDEYALPNEDDWEPIPEYEYGRQLNSRRHGCRYRRPITEKKVVKVDWRKLALFCSKAAEYIEGSAKRRDKGHIGNIRNLALEIEIKVAEALARERKAK